jgi:hypothetical protein
MSNGVVFMQGVNHGLANPQGDQPVTYFGKVFRIPHSEHDTIRQLEWEMSPADLLRQVTDAAGRLLTPIASAIERVETYDQDTGDVWVMYRIPYAIGESKG